MADRVPMSDRYWIPDCGQYDYTSEESIIPMWKPSIFCTDDELCKKAIDRAKKNDYKVKYRKALMNSLSKDAKKHGIDEWEAHKTFMHIELDRMLTRIVIFIMIVVAIVVTIIRSL